MSPIAELLLHMEESVRAIGEHATSVEALAELGARGDGLDCRQCLSIGRSVIEMSKHIAALSAAWAEAADLLGSGKPTASSLN